MALTGTDRGTGTNNVSNTSFTVSPTSNMTAGGLGVLVVAADNGSSGGATNDFGSTISDSLGNTWTLRQAPIFDNGAASAGVQGAIYTCNYTSAPQTSTTITVTTGAASVAKAWTIMEVTASVGTPTYLQGGVSAGATTTTPSMNTGSITIDNMVIAAIFNEQGTGQTITQDGDTTNGNWSTQQTNEIGTTAAGMSVASQRKIVTATATQTYNPTLGVSSDLIMAWIEVAEITFVPQDPFGMMGFFGI